MVQQASVTLGQSLIQQQSLPSADPAAQRGSQVTRQHELEAAVLSSPHLCFWAQSMLKQCDRRSSETSTDNSIRDSSWGVKGKYPCEKVSLPQWKGCCVWWWRVDEHLLKSVEQLIVVCRAAIMIIDNQLVSSHSFPSVSVNWIPAWQCLILIPNCIYTLSNCKHKSATVPLPTNSEISDQRALVWDQLSEPPGSPAMYPDQSHTCLWAIAWR